MEDNQILSERTDCEEVQVMSPEKIKSNLNDVVGDFLHYGLEAYIVRKETPRLCKMSFNEGIEDGGFRAVLKNMLVDILKSTYLSDDAEYADGRLMADNQKKILFFEQGDEFHPFAYVKNPTEYAEFVESDLNSAVGFLFCFRKGEVEIYFYQHLWSIMIPNKKKTNIMMKIFAGEDKVIFSEQKEPLLTIAKKIDIIILDGYLITADTKLLQNNFGFHDYINQSAKKVVEGISQTGLVANTNKLTDYIGRGKTKYAKKMMRIGNSKVLKMSKENLVDRVNTVERWKDKFDIDSESGEITLNTFLDVENLIDLFDERYCRSEITDTEYDTDVKSVAE